MKQYLIDEDTLRELLRAGHILAILERDGVDNWWGWMEGREEYLTDCLRELPWNEGKTYADLQEIVEEEDYSIDNLVDDEIEAFWEEYCPSGKWIITQGKNHECPFCHDRYHYVYPHCPSCGAKLESEGTE